MRILVLCRRLKRHLQLEEVPNEAPVLVVEVVAIVQEYPFLQWEVIVYLITTNLKILQTHKLDLYNSAILLSVTSILEVWAVITILQQGILYLMKTLG